MDVDAKTVFSVYLKTIAVLKIQAYILTYVYNTRMAPSIFCHATDPTYKMVCYLLESRRHLCGDCCYEAPYPSSVPVTPPFL